MGPLSDNMRGAALMTICMVAFTVNDAFMKGVLDQLPLFQAIFLRGLITSGLLLGLAIYLKALRLPESRRDRWLIALRTMAELIAAILFMTALANMPIANVAAILQMLPLTVPLAGALLFADPLGWRRLTAIGIGFVGVMLIVRPGTDGFNIYSVYALGAVLAVTVRDLAARRLSHGVSSLWVAWITAMAVAVVGGVGAMFQPWAPVNGQIWLFLTGGAIFVIIGYLTSVMAMRVGEIGFIAPFRYASLLAALVLGFLFFDEWPSVVTLVGAAIVVATGLFTLYRERQLNRLRFGTQRNPKV